MHAKNKKPYNVRVKQQKKVWARKADGVYLHRPSGFYYWRPGGRENRSWESLQTKNLTHAKEEYARLRYAKPEQPEAAAKSTISAGDVIRNYQKCGYPDKHKRKRPEATEADEAKHCEMLLRFWDKLPYEDAGPAACDDYHTWRHDYGFQHGIGNRQIDRELNTLSNACKWAIRSRLVKYNAVAERPRYQATGDVQHCREFMPHSADELHLAAAPFFQHPNSVVLGFQMCFEAYTALRTCEVLRFGEGIYGSSTPDEKYLNLWRCKGQASVNPYCLVHDGLAVLLRAHKAWLTVNYPGTEIFFPSHCGGVVDEGALSHALKRLWEKKIHKRRLKSHGMRAFSVLVRRSNGASDPQIAWEIGHKSGGACITSTYGGVPEEWRTGGGPKLSWLPTKAPLAWAELEKNGWLFEADTISAQSIRQDQVAA